MLPSLMGRPRRHGERKRRLAVRLYRDEGLSISLVTARLNEGARKVVSATWVYQVLDAAGVVRRCPAWPSSLVARAVELYVDQRLSARGVARELAAENGGRGPSHEWVHRRLLERGVYRCRSASQRARREAEAGQDYAEAERQAVALYGEGFGAPTVAGRLGVSKTTVLRWVRARRAADATRKRAWEAPTDAVRERLRKRAEVIRLRGERKTYAAIEEATGVSGPTIYGWLRAAGMVRAQPRRRVPCRYRLPGAPDEAMP
jgi:transposase